jgi:hypothetical protein
MFSAMATVHDFHLIGYSVDVDTRTTTLGLRRRSVSRAKIHGAWRGTASRHAPGAGKR